jgi:hypothetical protein
MALRPGIHARPGGGGRRMATSSLRTPGSRARGEAAGRCQRPISSLPSPATRAGSTTGSAPGYTGVLTYAVDALSTWLVPADLRAALYRALLLPAITMTETAADGRHCVSLVLDDGARRTDLLIDSANGQFAGLRRTLTRR